MLAACGSAAAAILLPPRRERAAALAVALIAAPLLVLGSVWDEPRVADFRDSPAQLGLALGLTVAGFAALFAVLRRWPGAFPVLAIIALPLRVPVEIGGETANLLVPLYLVIAAAAATSALAREAAPRPAGEDRWARWLRLALAATLVLYALQASYSEDVSNAIENIGFFLVPFAVLFVLLAELDWGPRMLRRALIAVAALTAACSLIAIYQYFARDLFLNPELFDANELHVYFRANSIFFDPNIFARYLALGITALAVPIAWARGIRREIALAALVCAIGLLGLAFSYSLTGFAALLAGLGLIAVMRGRLRGAVAFGGLAAAGLIALVIAGGTPTSDIEDYRTIDSGHADLVEGGLDLARDRPLAGWGSGAFGRAFYERIEPARTTVSHSEPITVAAEQGALGLIVYAGLLAVALGALLLGASSGIARTAVAACFGAMVVSSLGYTGFVSDPATWALLALGVALRPGVRSGRAADEAAGPGPPDRTATISA